MNKIGDKTTVIKLMGFDFVSDSQQCEELERYLGIDPKENEYDTYFVKQLDGDIIEAWGMIGVMPYNSMEVTLIYTK